MNELTNTIGTENTFGELLRHIKQAQQKVFAQANTALMELYW